MQSIRSNALRLITYSPLEAHAFPNNMAAPDTLGLECLQLERPTSPLNNCSRRKQPNSSLASSHQTKPCPRSNASSPEKACHRPRISTYGPWRTPSRPSISQNLDSRQRSSHSAISTGADTPIGQPHLRSSSLRNGPDYEAGQSFIPIHGVLLSTKESNECRNQGRRGKRGGTYRDLHFCREIWDDVVRPDISEASNTLESELSTRTKPKQSPGSVLNHHGPPLNHVNKLTRYSKDKVNSVPLTTAKGRWSGSPPPSREGDASRLGRQVSCSKKNVSIIDNENNNAVRGPTLVSFRTHRTSGAIKQPLVDLPAPKPSAIYQTMAHAQPKLLRTPQRFLLVLDLNGTLLYRPKASTNFTPRPSLARFLDYCFAHHSVLIWSSAQPANVIRICEKLFNSTQRSLILGEWARDTLSLTKAQYAARVQVYKRLTRVWADSTLQSKHPQFDQGQRWGQHNTILIDDSAKKASSEPFNHVEVPEFIKGGAKEDGGKKGVLSQVIDWVEEARKWDNVSAFVGHMQRRFAMYQA